MDSERINELLNKYWNCETSLEEEQYLREYFKAGPIADEHKDAALLFQYFGDHKKKSLPEETFDDRIVNLVSRKKSRVVQWTQNYMRIAAGIAVLLAATWFIQTEMSKTKSAEVHDTYEDPKLAFEETKKALMMISRGFGKAEQEAKKINLFNEAREEIQKPENDTTNL